MWDHTRPPEEMLPEQIIGLSEATGTTATPVVAPGSVADDVFSWRSRSTPTLCGNPSRRTFGG